MSFIEKHKAWLLPLLGLGVLGVGYMNFRTFQGDAPAAESAAPEPAPATGAPSAAGTPPAPEVPAEEPAPASGDLWADLKPLAVLPGSLADEDGLRKRARLPLDSELGEVGAASVAKPAWASLSSPSGPPAAHREAMAEAPAPAPEVEFLLHGPQGSSAWFGGRGYRPGERLQGSAYSVSRIGRDFVELSGPGGKILETTTSIHAAGLRPDQTPEAP